MEMNSEGMSIGNDDFFDDSGGCYLLNCLFINRLLDGTGDKMVIKLSVSTNDCYALGFKSEFIEKIRYTLLI